MPTRPARYVERMQQRYLGRTGLKVSRLGLGTLTWGRDTDEHEAREQLIAFTEAGGTLVDTAAGYGEGASEELVGSLLAEVVRRDEVVIATKAGISRARGSRVTNASRGYLISTLDASLNADPEIVIDVPTVPLLGLNFFATGARFRSRSQFAWAR